MAKKCNICKSKFGLFLWEYTCVKCGKSVCDDCSRLATGFNRVCEKCIKQQKNNNVIVVKSDHIGGHEIISKVGKISSDKYYRDMNMAVKNLKKIAKKNKANAVIKLEFKKKTGAEPSYSGSNNTHYYSLFKANGVAVVVIKK